MLKIRVLEETNFFPICSYRLVCEYNNVICVTVGNYYGFDDVEYFRLHLEDGKEATFRSDEYIMEVVEK